MDTTLKVTKYQLHDLYKAVIVFYTIILFVLLDIAVMTRRLSEEVTFGGLGMATVIFMLIAGLDCFWSSFKFLLAYNVSRKSFYYGNTAALITVAAFMALADTALSSIFSIAVSYKSLLAQLYGTGFVLAEFFWSFGLYAFFVCLGWLITMLYYRADRLMKIIISVAPIAMVILFIYTNRQIGGAAGRAMIGFLNRAMGFAYGNNAYIGALSFFIGTAVLLLFCLLLIRRAPIKD